MSHEHRTLPPTAQRRQQARLEGNVAVSAQVTAAAVWLSVTAASFFAGVHGLAALKLLFAETWAAPGTPSSVVMQATSLATRVAVPLLVMIVSAAFVARLGQVGHIWAPGRVLPRAGRINPGRQLGELFSSGRRDQALLAAALSVGGIALVSWGIWSQRTELLQLVIAADLEMAWLHCLSTWALRLGIFLVAFAALDYAYQRYRFELSLRMSPEELKAEIKAVQGNPQVAGSRREMRREIRQLRGAQQSN